MPISPDLVALLRCHTALDGHPPVSRVSNAAGRYTWHLRLPSYVVPMGSGSFRRNWSAGTYAEILPHGCLHLSDHVPETQHETLQFMPLGLGRGAIPRLTTEPRTRVSEHEPNTVGGIEDRVWNQHLHSGEVVMKCLARFLRALARTDT